MKLIDQPQNILIGNKNIGVIDFEMSSSIGDPVYDLVTFLGHYNYCILVSSTDTSWEEAIQNTLHAYQHTVGQLSERMYGRVVPFAGAILLHMLGNKDRSLSTDVAERVRQVGTTLVAQGIHSKRALGQILCETISYYSRPFHM